MIPDLLPRLGAQTSNPPGLDQLSSSPNVFRETLQILQGAGVVFHGQNDHLLVEYGHQRLLTSTRTSRAIDLLLTREVHILTMAD